MTDHVMTIRQTIHFSGRVQGVGFRYTTRELAAGFAVTGFVQNLSDGRVLVVVEGAAEEVASFVAALERRMARYVDGRSSLAASATGEFDGFDVRR